MNRIFRYMSAAAVVAALSGTTTAAYASSVPVPAAEKCAADAIKGDNRPELKDRLFRSKAVEKEIKRVRKMLRNPKLAWMFANCFPNTLDTTVHFRKGADDEPDTFVYTGDIHAMWLRDSGAQVWPYVQLANSDPELKEMLAGVILRQFKCINIDPYANAFNDGAIPDGHWMSDMTDMKPELHERNGRSTHFAIPSVWHISTGLRRAMTAYSVTNGSLPSPISSPHSVRSSARMAMDPTDSSVSLSVLSTR